MATTYLMSTTVIPSGADGTWTMKTLPLQEARALNALGSVSAIGHQSTAEIISELLGAEVPMNRINVIPREGDLFLCFKLNSRPPEGAILSREEIEKVGYCFCAMRYLRAE
jgi:hypothetical protein